jgi:hypothetical protein
MLSTIFSANAYLYAAGSCCASSKSVFTSNLAVIFSLFQMLAFSQAIFSIFSLAGFLRQICDYVGLL